jgi:hypothetical protein
MTKNELCQIIVNNHFSDTEITSSSTLAVAMGHLGLIKSQEMRDYAASRGGIVFSGFTDEGYKIFSFRELLSYLPD